MSRRARRSKDQKRLKIKETIIEAPRMDTEKISKEKETTRLTSSKRIKDDDELSNVELEKRKVRSGLEPLTRGGVFMEKPSGGESMM